MRKIISILCAGSLLASAAIVSVAAAADTSSGQTNFGIVTIPTTNVPSASNSFTYSPSPNVGMNILSSATAYSIMAANSVTNTTNGMEYGTLNTATGYAQGTKTTLAGKGPSTTGQTSTTLSTDVTWGWMGGS